MNDLKNLKRIVWFAFSLILVIAISFSSVVLGSTSPVTQTVDGEWECSEFTDQSGLAIYLRLVGDNGPKTDRSMLQCRYQCQLLDKPTIFSHDANDEIDDALISRQCCIQYTNQDPDSGLTCFENGVCFRRPE
ncbi:MAG: hypothetical protein ACLFUO_05905, partial [Candidatus Woesearchaeota archaeon]